MITKFTRSSHERTQTVHVPNEFHTAMINTHIGQFLMSSHRHSTCTLTYLPMVTLRPAQCRFQHQITTRLTGQLARPQPEIYFRDISHPFPSFLLIPFPDPPLPCPPPQIPLGDLGSAKLPSGRKRSKRISDVFRSQKCVWLVAENIVLFLLNKMLKL